MFCVCLGGSLCLRHSPHGSVLVHWGVASGGDRAAADHPVPRPRHHAVQRRKTKCFWCFWCFRHHSVQQWCWCSVLFQLFLIFLTSVKKLVDIILSSCCKSSLLLLRCVCSTWRTPTCCLWGGWWSPLPWSTGTSTNASRSESCWWSESDPPCESHDLLHWVVLTHNKTCCVVVIKNTVHL